MAKTTTKTSRPKRIPVGANRNVLTTDGVPDGYVGRWVSDKPQRIQKFLDGGYEFVTDKGVLVGDRTVDKGERETDSVRTLNVGGGDVGYLMAIRKEWYDEDQKSKADEIADKESEMFRKLANRGEGTYGDISIN